MEITFRVIIERFNCWYFLTKPDGSLDYRDQRSGARRSRKAIREGAQQARLLWTMDGSEWSVFQAWVRQDSEESGFVNAPRSVSEKEHPDGWQVPAEIKKRIVYEKGLDTDSQSR